MADVFVSYARPDRERVKSLVDLLEDRGWSVWWDREIVPGETFEQLIDAEIQAARCVVAVWTEHSVESEWVRAEAGEGMDRGILVPVMFDPVRVPVAFRRMDAANLIGWPRRRNAVEVARFLTGVAQRVDREVSPTPIVRAPVRWGRWLGGAVGALLVTLALVAAYVYLTRSPDGAPTTKQNVTVVVRPFDPGDGDGLGLEYELERRLRASPGLAARVSAEPNIQSDYFVTGERQGSVLTIELDDRNGVAITSRSVDVGADLAALADDLCRELLVRLGRAADVVARFDADVPPEAFRDYLKANSLLRSSLSEQTLAKAQGLYAKVLDSVPRFAAAHAGLCRAFLVSYIQTRDDGYVAKAEQHCHRALTLDDQDSTVYVALGLLYRETGMDARSVDSYRRALALAPYSTDAMRGLADTLAQTGAFEDAERWLRDAIALEPNYWENYHALGNFLYRAGRFDEAVEAFRSALALTPNESRVLNNVGTASFMADDLEAAVDFWQRAAEKQPSAATYLNLGAAYFLLRDFASAADMYREAQRLAPDDHFTWGHLGEALYAARDENFKGQFERAIELARERLSIDPRDRWTRAALGAYYAALGEKDRALELADEALTEGPNDVEVVYNVAVVRARMGDVVGAAESLAHLVALGYPSDHLARDANFDGVPPSWRKQDLGRK